MIEPGNDLPEGRPSRYARPVPTAGAPGPRAATPESPELPPAKTERKGRARRLRRKARSASLPPKRATMFRIAGPPAALAVVATIALAVALARPGETRDLAANAWLLAIGGLVVWTCWRALTRAVPTAASSAFDTVRRRAAEPRSRVRDMVEIEGVIIDAEWSWRGVEYRLRPLLRKTAAARLLERHQVDLESEPEAARRIVGDDLWALVGPAAYGPVGAVPANAGPIGTEPASAGIAVEEEFDGSRTPLGRGIPRATIRRAIEALEEL